MPNSTTHAGIDWGSGGTHPFLGTDSVSEFIAKIFNAVATGSRALRSGIAVSKYDLFHGHMFYLPALVLGANPDFGTLFHARELPEDAMGEPSGYNTTLPDFKYRMYYT